MRMLRERAAGGGHHREWGAQVVRNRGQQRVAQRLTLGGDARLLGDLRKTGALQCQRHLSGESAEQMTLLRQQHVPRIARADAEDPDRAALFTQWQIQPRRGRQGIGAEARRLTMVSASATL